MFIKDSIQKIAGYTLLSAGLFILLVGFGMLLDPDEKDRKVAPSIIVVSNVFTIPGIFLVYLGKKSRRRENRLKSISGLVTSYRRISLSDIADKTGLDRKESEALLLKAISMELVKGNFDRTTGEFYTEDAIEDTNMLRYCPSCGGQFDHIYLKGDTVKCERCGYTSI
jgi:ribosomal protein S27AE